MYLSKAILQTCFLLSFIVVSPVSVASEQQILVDGDLIAIYNNGLTAGNNKKPKAVVLMIHGWASQMNEVGDMYLRLAAQLALRDYASLRINIRGESEGEKSRYRLTSTFASRIADAQAGLKYLQKHHPGLPVAVVGFSLGGATAMALAGKEVDAIDSVVLWSTAGDPAHVLNTMPAKVVNEVLNNGAAKLQQWVELTITRQHLLGMLGYDIFNPLKNYSGALLSIRGSDDFVTPQELTIFSHASASPEESVVISGADHIYHSLSTDKQYVERVLAHTVRWFEDTLSFR
ncbi:alpha/beta fold hydrolase [Paraglaciecola aquimarina]|uniref:Alpha/beta fold hydrolase n=1 Tax=Paraglaciecola aquimarina TaxID=1235557 RepID=A0ABU3SW43_9ALTE|nr:alpha/beta fold hydrolase [Paraglaciecola aquimarina]MDU0354231.1 alpha/beta fold hydrolase [Paraglaciecola aquimarina]